MIMFLGLQTHCDRIATDENVEPKWRLEAGRLKLECSVGLVRLLYEGLKY